MSGAVSQGKVEIEGLVITSGEEVKRFLVFVQVLGLRSEIN